MMPDPGAHRTRTASGTRAILHRTRGRGRGPVLRLMSPGDLGRSTKPFVFLDLFSIEPTTPARFGMHPHSGIATLTALVRGEMHYQDRHGAPSSLSAGGMEWMMAGGGVWHGGALTSPAAATGFQLWISLPPGLEDAPAEELFLKPGEVPAVGPARVLLGEYHGTRSRVAAPSPMTYLHVTLRPGERWTLMPPAGHTVAWIAVHEGAIATPARIDAGELVVFEEGQQPVTFLAETGAGFVVGTAVKHAHDLVTGHYSVHTNPASLAGGEARIAELGEALRRAGRLA